MNPVVMELMNLYSGDPFDLMVDEDGFLRHDYEAQGMSVSGPGGRTAEASKNGVGSGRYHKGEGEHPYQHGISGFLERVDFYKKSGVTNQKDLAALCGYTKPDGSGNTTTFRVAYTQALHEWKIERAEKARSMLASGEYKNKKAVAQALGIRDSTLTSWLNPKSLERVGKAQVMADFLEKQLKEKGMIDVGDGVEKEIGITKTKLAESLAILESKGYQVLGGRVPQATNPGNKTTLKVLATKDYSTWDVYNRPELIQSINDYTFREGPDGVERPQEKWKYPASLDSSRLMIRYKDDVAPDGHTGLEKDGTIELRRNVPDLDLKGSRYSQVRILVDGNKYLKGMAHYSDDMPDGIDVIFNTNKTRDKADIVLKKAKDDPKNPFGALLRQDGGQYTYMDHGVEKLGLINKTRQEGDWQEWKDSLPSQFLAKQPMALINKQLNEAITIKKTEFADIMNLTNPTVKKALLEDFADGCDSDAVSMHAASLPRQKYQVILPCPTLKDDEVYAPNFHDGETIALIRFPHQGTFEIPILKVNNRNPQGQSIMGTDPIDAVGVNKKNADRLSGADFDGDTVMCVPCNDPKYSDTKIMSVPLLEGLEDFDPKDKYGYDAVETRIEKVRKKDRNGKTIYDDEGKPVYEDKKVDHYFRNGHEFKQMTRTGLEMGVVSNLMMDMTLKGAGPDHLAMVARHAQVVIDAEKHHLDWKQSEKDNHIAELKKMYQERVEESDGSIHYGASTLLTRAKSPTQVVKPTGTPHIDPETGKMVYTEKQLKPQTFVDKKTGKTRTRMIDVNLLDTKDDAYDLVFDKNNPKEAAYANYSNMLRAMANEARKAILATGDIEFNKNAEAKYHEEVEHLMAELKLSELNAPRERMAQLYSRSIYLAKQKDNPDITKKELKKAANEALVEGRVRFNASRHKIDISPREWEAIQSGAVNKTNLVKILKYADSDKVREYATPRDKINLTSGQIARIKNALSEHTSASMLAAQYHVSISTINRIRNNERE